MSLKSEIFGLLDNTLHLCRDCQAADELAKTLAEMRRRLETPLRVAVVGIMKAGKSTFMNALMGAEILCTGSLETTYTVCWFRYGDLPRLTICFRDGEEEDAPYEDLAKWSAREYEKQNARMNDVKYLIIYYPSEVLRTIEFIDTPGLNSVYGTDAQNTLDFLSIKGTEDTLYEAGMADAVIYAFSQTARGFDQNILQAFHKGGTKSASPINSVGLLTKVDATGIWNVLEPGTPVDIAQSVAATVMRDPEMSRLLYTILPVCAKVCEGFSQLKQQEWETLQKAAAIDPEELRDLLFDAEQFAISQEEMFLALGSADARGRLIGLLGQYGILEISEQLRMGKETEEIGDVLQKKCGVQAVRELLLSHFGNRTFLIKAQFIFNHLRMLAVQFKKDSKTSDRVRNICGQLLDGIDELMTSVQTLKELQALQMYYNGQLALSEEEKLDFLQITGEYGRSAESRLGIQGSRTVAELASLAQQKIACWHGKASGFMLPRAYVESASIVVRSYEQMYYHLKALSEE